MTRPVWPADLAPLALGTVLFAEFFLGDLDLGPVSSRIYLLGAAGVFVAAKAHRERRLFQNRAAALIAGLGVLYAAIDSAFAIWRGGDLAATIAHQGSTTLFSVAAFTVAQSLLGTRRSRAVLIGLIAAFVALDGVVAIAQWLGLPGAWAAADALRPPSPNPDVVRGLSLYSINLGYVLVLGTAAAVGAAWLMIERVCWRIAATAAMTASLVMASWASLSRSAAAGVALVLAVLVIAVWHGRSGRSAAALAVAAGLGVLAAFIVIRTAAAVEAEAGRYSVDRLADTGYSNRAKLAAAGVEAWLASPITGDPDRYYAGQATAPHNGVINVAYSTGLLGLAVAGALTVVVGLACWRAVRASCQMGVTELWIATAATAGVAGYVFNSMFHNDGLPNGSAPVWWLIAVIAAFGDAALETGRFRSMDKVAILTHRRTSGAAAAKEAV